MALFLVILLVHPQPAMLAEGTTAPPITLNTATGHLDSVVGDGTGAHPVLVEFLGTTCPTCINDAAQLCSAAAQAPSGLVVGIDASNDSASAVEAFAARYLAPPCNVALLLDPGMRVSQSYVITVVPTVYVVDTHGNIAFGGFGASGIAQGIDSFEQLAHA